jgi:hypothetical protein
MKEAGTFDQAATAAYTRRTSKRPYCFVLRRTRS